MRVNYYKRHLGDYAKRTRTLTTYEHGVYNLLLDLYYSEEGPFTTDDAMAVCQAKSKPERSSVAKVLDRYFTESDEGWRNSRADEEIAKYQEKSAKNAAIGSLGGKQKAKRAASDSLSETLENRQANDNPSHKPVTNTKLPPSAGDESPADAGKPIETSTEPAKAETPPAKPVDPVKLIFDKGVALLTAAGSDDPSARSFLGKLRREHGDVKVLAALVRAESEHPTSPVEWLTKTVPAMGSSPKLSSVHIGKQQFGLGFGARK